MFVLALASMAVTLSAHTLGCKLVSIVSVLVDSQNLVRTHLVGTIGV